MAGRIVLAVLARRETVARYFATALEGSESAVLWRVDRECSYKAAGFSATGLDYARCRALVLADLQSEVRQQACTPRLPERFFVWNGPIHPYKET